MAFFGISVSEDLLAPLNLSCLRSQVANLRYFNQPRLSPSFS